ncbi:MAG: VOC family protein [Patescibacteria group bacterium]|nr:VOC family protein [Patescibacteria group bacterium]
MQKNPIGWVEIPVTDLDRAEKFYTDYFGYEMQRQPEKNGYNMSFFPMDMESYGSGAMLMKGEGYIPTHEGVVVYFPAPGGTIVAALEKAEKMGIKVISPKMAIGENGFMAMIEDSEGNGIALHSMEG